MGDPINIFWDEFLFDASPNTLEMACTASISARVCPESLDNDQKGVTQ